VETVVTVMGGKDADFTVDILTWHIKKINEREILWKITRNYGKSRNVRREIWRREGCCPD
jgi:uncharacterized protein (DUF2344 family)